MSERDKACVCVCVYVQKDREIDKSKNRYIVFLNKSVSLDNVVSN